MADGKLHLQDGELLLISGKLALCDNNCCCDRCVGPKCDGGVSACCWKIVIAGITEGSCGSCATLNSTWYAAQTSDPGVFVGRCASFACGVTEIRLVVSETGGTYKITVTLGPHTWEETYVSAIDCCTLAGENLPHTASGGTCDSSSATAVVTAILGGVECDTECCTEYCEDGKAPDGMAITFPAFTAGGACSPYQCSCLGGTYYTNFDDCGGSTDPNPGHYCVMCGMARVSVQLTKVVNNYFLTVNVYTGGDDDLIYAWEKDLGTDVPDCWGFDETLTLITNEGQCSPPSTCLVQAAHGATPTEFPDDICVNCDGCGYDYPDQVRIHPSTNVANGVCNDASGPPDFASCEDSFDVLLFLDRVTCPNGQGCVYELTLDFNNLCGTLGRCEIAAAINVSWRFTIGRSGNQVTLRLAALDNGGDEVWAWYLETGEDEFDCVGLNEELPQVLDCDDRAFPVPQNACTFTDLTAEVVGWPPP